MRGWVAGCVGGWAGNKGCSAAAAGTEVTSGAEGVSDPSGWWGCAASSGVPQPAQLAPHSHANAFRAALEFERRKQNVAAILLHPGTVDTDLSKPFQKVSSRGLAQEAAGPGRGPPGCRLGPPTSPRVPAIPKSSPPGPSCPPNPVRCARCAQNVPAEKLFSRERAVRQLLAIIDRTSMRENGRFFDWAGEEVEW